MKRTKTLVAAGVLAAVATVAVSTSASADHSVDPAKETTAVAFKEAAQGPEKKSETVAQRGLWKEVAKKAAASFAGSAAYDAAKAHVKKQYGKAPKGYFVRGGAAVSDGTESVDLNRAFD
ncbi:hypothetical protein JQK87_04080 [Streptomyces sp. G44]|uniref:hypothetical protein n=1 Tax=Streptomyces sp. G44 TaxID=2807632 RepID=UPI00196035A4|nr:hypothetical protein [Streptomyces sp. G44]MBM7167597.1 hypothetical protein [Streptomyces sp. G44]